MKIVMAIVSVAAALAVAFAAVTIGYSQEPAAARQPASMGAR
ncbi:hypothetical protein ACFL5O_01750 [Myxococcota bacterium]